MRAHILLLAGGSGARFGGDVAKQMLPLAGLPLFAHSLLTFLQWRPARQIVICARADLIDETLTVAERCLRQATPAAHSTDRPRLLVVPGGSSRHGSAVAAAAALESEAQKDDLVLFHDAARPFVSLGELDRLVACLSDPTCSVASLVGPIHDTVIRGRVPGTLSGVLDRNETFLVKTPQALHAGHVRAFIETPEDPRLTDLLTWAEAAGLRSALALADPDNQKLTLTEDLPLFEAIAARRASAREARPDHPTS